MAQFEVTATKLNKRSLVPPVLPYAKGIAGVVYKGYKFEAQEAAASEVPNPALGKWYKDGDGYFYWGGAIVMLKPSVPAAPVSTDIGLTAEQVKGAAGVQLLATAEKFLPYLIDTCSRYKINTPVRQLCFLAQLGHESAGLYYTEELASGKAYEGRTDLGNTHPGDGVKFKGRGLIQITGRGNYQWISKDLGVDFVNNPTWLGGKNASVCTPSQLKYATLSAGWYWNNHSLNALADKVDIGNDIDEGANLDNFKLITKRINGGYNGLADRLSRYRHGVELFR